MNKKNKPNNPTRKPNPLKRFQGEILDPFFFVPFFLERKVGVSKDWSESEKVFETPLMELKFMVFLLDFFAKKGKLNSTNGEFWELFVAVKVVWFAFNGGIDGERKEKLGGGEWLASSSKK